MVMERLSEVRSLIPQHVHIMALTATATEPFHLSISRLRMYFYLGCAFCFASLLSEAEMVDYGQGPHGCRTP